MSITNENSKHRGLIPRRDVAVTSLRVRWSDRASRICPRGFLTRRPKRMVSLEGSEHPREAGIRQAGKADPNEILKVTLHLRSRNHAKNFLDREIAALIAGRRKPMTREEWQEKYGADPADVKKIEALVSEHGLTVGATHFGARMM